MLAVTLQSRELTELQRKALDAGLADEAARAGAIGAQELVRNHLFSLDARGNKFGAPSTHFYANAADSITDPTVAGGEASFQINQVGLAQRWLGGTIRAGVGTSSETGLATKYLAMPARTEAYGHSPRDFKDLHFVPLGPDRGMLVQALQTELRAVGPRGGKKKLGQPGSRIVPGDEKGGLAMFWLATEVTQEEDRSVMPTEEEMAEAASTGMNNLLAMRLGS